MSKDYTIRKQQSDKIAMDYLNDQDNFLNNIRKHDMSDAMLMILYYYKTSVDKLLVSRKNVITDLDFGKFKFLI